MLKGDMKTVQKLGPHLASALTMQHLVKHAKIRFCLSAKNKKIKKKQDCK